MMAHHKYKVEKLKEFRGQLNNFPHSFDMADMKKLGDKKLEHLLEKLVSRRKFIDEEDKRRNANFSSYILFLKRKTGDAYKKNDMVLKSDPENIVALANKAEMLWHDSEYSKADECVKQLKALQGKPYFTDLKDVAQAELAYSYARTVPQFYPKSAELYCAVNKRYTNKYLWQFGEAQVMRRCFTKYSQNPHEDFSRIVIKTRKLLLTIGTSESAGKVLNAKAWTELGELYSLLDHKYLPFSKDVLQEVLSKDPNYKSKECYKKALDLDTEDAYVLERCGRYYRDIGDQKRSKELLERAISTEESPFSHHHLAKTLIEMTKKSLSLTINEQTIKDAIQHLEKSLELTKGFNVEAEFDLGFIHQEMREYEKAIEYFKNIISISSYVTGPIDVIKAYEQIGYCKLKKGLHDESKIYFTKAVEVISRLIVSVPSLTEAALTYWKAFPTITDLLNNNWSSTRKPCDIKAIAHLHKLVGKYKESLDFYEELCRMSQEEAADSTVRMNMIENYIKVEQYDNACALLNLALCTTDRESMSQEFVFSVYLKIANHNLKANNLDKAKSFFLNAFEFKHGAGKDLYSWDVMILYDDRQAEQEAYFLYNILHETCGLRVSKNIENAPAGKMESENFVNFMSSSKTLIVLCVNGDHLEYYINLAIDRRNTTENSSLSLIVPVTVGDAEIVDVLKAFRSRQMPSPPPVGQDAMSWLNNFFPALLESDLKTDVPGSNPKKRV